MITVVTDTADWLLAQPLKPAPGTVLDFSGTPIRVAFSDVCGGPPIVTASTEDDTLRFVPASGAVLAHFVITLPVKRRTLRVSAPVRVLGDIERWPNPADRDQVEWLGRIHLEIHPGSASAGITRAGLSPVLLPVQPYGAPIAVDAMRIGPQGVPGNLPPAPSDAATRTYTLALVAGVLAWRAAD